MSAQKQFDIIPGFPDYWVSQTTIDAREDEDA